MDWQRRSAGKRASGVVHASRKLEEELKHCGGLQDADSYFKTYAPVLKSLANDKFLKDEDPTQSYATASAAAHADGRGVVSAVPMADHLANLEWWDRWFETAESRKELVRKKKFPERFRWFVRFSMAVCLAKAAVDGAHRRHAHA